MENKNDLYVVLGVPHTATPLELRKSYYKIVQRTHPDRYPGDEERLQLFQEASRAYAVLSDPVKRRRYDYGFEPVMSVHEFFRRSSTARRIMQELLPKAPAAPQRGVDMAMGLEIPKDLLDAGGPLQVDLPSFADGDSIQVVLDIPKGVERMPYCRLKGFGPEGVNGGDRADLLIVVTQERKRR